MLLAVVQQQKVISWLSPCSLQHLSAHCFAPAARNGGDLMQSFCSHQHHFHLQQAAVFSSKAPIDPLYAVCNTKQKMDTESGANKGFIVFI